MRNRFFFFSLLLFAVLPLAGASQHILATLEITKRDPLPRFFEISPGDRGLVTFGNMVRNSSRYLGLTKYDENFLKQWNKQVIEQNGRNNVDFLSVIGSNIFVFVSEFYPKENSIRTYYYRFDLEGNLLDDHKVISELTNEKEHRVDLKYEVSLNRKTLLCYKNFNSANDKEVIQYFIFDESGEMVRDGDLELPYTDDQLQVRKVLVSNQGNLFVLGKKYIENKINSPDDYQFVILRYDTEGNWPPNEMSLRFGDQYITDINFKIDRDENVYAGGFYSNRSTYEITGTVFKKFNAAGEELMGAAEKFPEAFLSKFLTGRQIEKGLELKNFYLDEIVLRSDGGVLLIAEKYYTTFSSMLDVYGYWVDRQIHHYDEIIVNSVSAYGSIEWSTVVAKYQASENNINLSYFPVVTGEGLDLIYEYSPRNMPQTLYVNHVGMDGSTGERDVLQASIGRNVTFFPRSCEQISNSEAMIVLYREKEKGYAILRMDFSQ